MASNNFGIKMIILIIIMHIRAQYNATDLGGVKRRNLSAKRATFYAK